MVQEGPLPPSRSARPRLRALVLAAVVLAAFVVFVPVAVAQAPLPATSVAVALNPNPITANGTDTSTATVTVTNEIDPTNGDVVVITRSDDSMPAVVASRQGSGTYTATITSSTKAGDVTITATDESVQPLAPSGTATLHQVAGPATKIDLALSSPSIPADGSSTSTATVTLHDANGNPVLQDPGLAITSNGGQAITSPPTSHGDGTYTATVTASGIPGTSTISATDNGLVATAILSQSDVSAPTIVVETPTNGAEYPQGDVVRALFGCVDPDGGDDVASCFSPVASGQRIDTTHPGRHLLVIHATDRAGNAARRTIDYTVVATTPSKRASLATIAPPTPLRFAGSSVLVPIRCVAGGAPCAGSVVVTATVPGRTSGHGRRRARARHVTLARGRYSVRAARRATVVVRLTRGGSGLLARLHRLSAVVTVTLAEPAERRPTVSARRLTLVAPRRRGARAPR